jgi:hypothetical protein
MVSIVPCLLLVCFGILSFAATTITTAQPRAVSEELLCTLAGGIFDKNFSLLGQGEKGETLVKDAANVYKFYATGRRHVQVCSRLRGRSALSLALSLSLCAALMGLSLFFTNHHVHVP